MRYGLQPFAFGPKGCGEERQFLEGAFRGPSIFPLPSSLEKISLSLVSYPGFGELPLEGTKGLGSQVTCANRASPDTTSLPL